MTDLAPTISDPGSASEDSLAAAFTAMVQHDEFPCLGARSAFRRDRASIHVYGQLGTAQAAAQLLTDLTAYADAVDPTAGFASFIALFRGPATDEKDFEALLWAQLRLLHRADEAPWSPDVSADPDDPHFAFSVGGTPFFVVGLHPGASRDARRAPVPTLVFNLHEQFEELRASGRFTRMRDAIRERDIALQGDLNPMVDDHGGSTEARQYSGREVGDDWSAPFEERS
ncbi:MAG: guanitoxin biosynthesis heme-dependent pre-guanitoxin N-hydroxylase GntA [Lapillicoccus sp.]